MYAGGGQKINPLLVAVSLSVCGCCQPTKLSLSITGYHAIFDTSKTNGVSSMHRESKITPSWIPADRLGLNIQ